VHQGGTGVAHLGPYLETLAFEQPEPPRLAHRLDRGTSGCLVLGRHREASKQKTYGALTAGIPPEEAGRIDAPLLKLDPRRGRMAIDPAGQEARSDYRILGRRDGIAWLELKPLTGRSHQLRVHLASIGCPILGDRLYGAGQPGEELCLLARRIALPFYWQQPPIIAEACVPPHMVELLTSCDGK
jgi:23S rRNA-/tRNA-specific pseudouridylate synthase